MMFGSSVWKQNLGRMSVIALALWAKILCVIFLVLVSWAPLVSWALVLYWALQAILELACLYLVVIVWILVELYGRVFSGSGLEVLLQSGFEALVLLVDLLVVEE